MDIKKLKEREGNTPKEKIEEPLRSVRPYLQADEGDVELVDVNDEGVVLRLAGPCQGCPGATMTLRMDIERMLKERVPEVKTVVAV